MSSNYVGAGILSIITESLYDNPIVVFREYVQNSVDSIFKEHPQDDYEIKIWNTNNDLFFLDNGQGIDTQNFLTEMKKIGASTKKRQKNLGYKGIGRLSGVPYCTKLFFVNICDYSNKKVQIYTIDSERYERIKNDEQYEMLNFTELMDKIGNFTDVKNFSDFIYMDSVIKKYRKLLEKTNTGFLVILQDISSVLKNTIDSEDFFINLQWLLPVDFDSDLYTAQQKELFIELIKEPKNEKIPPVRYCKISYNDNPIFRPIKKEMLRNYVCKNNFKYAVGFHSFKGDKIFIDKTNLFTGIRIYIDNMLLCDENELLQNLNNYGLLSHTLNGQLQSVRGIGAMIYITDKINISANARRTFIEVTDNDSLEFLKLLAEFVNTIYDTRYALSNYVSAKTKQNKDIQRLQQLKDDALNNLKKLAKEDVELTVEDDAQSFEDLNIIEQKRFIKNRIISQLDLRIKEYLTTVSSYNFETAYKDFLDWLKIQP